MLHEKKQKIYKAISVALALLLWQAGATALDSGLLLASPWEVLVRLTTLWREPGFWSAVWFTFSRIVLGFLLAFVLGTGLGLLAGRWKGAELFLWPYMLTIKTVPVASFIILSLVFLKARQLSVFISFLMVLPVLYSNVLQGVKSTDKALLEMARVYRVPYGRRLLYIHLPHLKPFVLSGCSTALGLCWKAGVAAEVIGVVSGSLGERLYDAKIYLMTADLLAWTVVIVALSAGFEKLVLWLLRHIFRRIGGAPA